MANRVSIILQLRDRFSKGLQQAQTRFQKFADSITGVGGVIAGVIGVSLLDFAAKTGRSARDAEAAGRKFSTVFKGVQDDVNEWAREYSKDFGIAESATKRLAGTLGDFLVPIGATREQAFAMTRAVSEVAGAIALFDNTAPEQVFEDILSAFAGSSEVLLKYGTVVTETALKQEALRFGFEKTTDQLDPYVRSLLITNSLIESQEDALSQLTVTQRNQQAQINASIAALRAEQEQLGKGVTALQAWGAQLIVFFFNVREKVQSAIEFAGNAVGEMIAKVSPGFAKLREDFKEVSNAADSQAEGMRGLSDEAKRQAEEVRKLDAEIKQLIADQVKVFNATVRSTKAQKETTKVVKETASAFDDLSAAHESASRSARSFAEQQKALREQEQAAAQSIPERLAQELQRIRDERESLLTNTSISRQQRKRELDDLVRSEEYVNRLASERGITQERLAEALRRENRPQIAKDVEAIEKRIADIRDRQNDLEERADQARLENRRRILEVERKITQERERAARTGGGGGSGRPFNFGAPAFGNLGLRSLREERSV